MIDIFAKETDVDVRIKGRYPVGDYTWTFSSPQMGKAQAALLAHNLHAHLEGKLRDIREAAYLEGWKDAKAKKQKQKWFRGWW